MAPSSSASDVAKAVAADKEAEKAEKGVPAQADEDHGNDKTHTYQGVGVGHDLARGEGHDKGDDNCGADDPQGKPHPKGKFPCFAAGTLLQTAGGFVPIEQLRQGDLVQTMDDGLQPVAWIGQNTVAGRGPMTPVKIPKGVIGNQRDLIVSPQHRMLISDWRCQYYFGEPQLFSSAKGLIGRSGIEWAPMQSVTYVHLAFERHQVIFAEGAPSESLHTGPEAMSGLPDWAQQELEQILGCGIRARHLARPTISIGLSDLLAA